MTPDEKFKHYAMIYYQEHGDLYVKLDTVIDGYRLGRKISGYRVAKKGREGRALSKEMEQWLDEHGMVWDAAGRTGHVRAVVCMEEPGRIFLSMAEASGWAGIKSGNICCCIHGLQHSAGIHPVTGEVLHWMAADQWEAMSKKEQEERLNQLEDGVSYPNKFGAAFFAQLAAQGQIADFRREVAASDLFPVKINRSYDFGLSLTEPDRVDLLVEFHGGQHLAEDKRDFSGKFGRSKQEEIDNDRLKQKLAYRYGFSPRTYLVVNCRESRMEHMVEMIGKSPLAALFDLRGIDWEKCERQALDSYVKQVCALYAQGYPLVRIAEQMKLGKCTVPRYLKRGAAAGLCGYQPVRYEQVRIICVETGQIFPSMAEAARFCNISSGNLGQILNTPKAAGKDPQTGRLLHWQDYESWRRKSPAEREEICKEIASYCRQRPIVCQEEPGLIFESTVKAAAWCDGDPSSISKCLHKIYGHTGKHPVTKEPLHWSYYGA